MQFALTEDQSILVDPIREFARKELSPGHEPEPARRLKQVSEMGLLGLRIPEAHQGMGLDALSLCRCITAVSRANASVGLMLAAINGWAVEALLRCGSEAQQAAHFPSLLAGERWIAWASPSQPEALVARQEGEGWSLQGAVDMVPVAEIAQQFLVVATDSQGARRGFLLPAEHPGLEIAAVGSSLGMREAAIGRLQCDLRASKDHEIGPGGLFAQAYPALFASGQCALAAVAVGLGQAALDESVSYARERQQFGKPIAAFQAIQWKVADMAMAQEGARLLVDRAAHGWEHNPHDNPWAQSARLASQEHAAWAGQEAIQIHGGYGYTTEFPVERLYRDAHTLRACWNAPQTLSEAPLHHAI